MSNRNAMLGGITAVVVAGAVLGLGFLMTRGGPSRRGPEVAAVDQKKAPRQITPPTGPVKKTPTTQASTAPVAVQGSVAPVGDVCAKVDEILRGYDALVQPQLTPGAAPDMSVITNLRERSQKIEEIVEQLAALGQPAVPCLTDQVRLDARLQRIDRQTIEIRALAKIPGAASLQALAEALTTSDAWGVKMSVVAQLAEHGGAEGLAILAQRLEMEQDFRIRGAILKYLGQHKSEAGIMAARRMAQGDENPHVRTAALRALDDAKDRGSLAVIEERARNDQDMMVRQNAIQIYGRVGGEGGLPVLEEFLRNESNFRVKTVTIQALAEMASNGSDQARATLERYQNDLSQSEDVRQRISNALAGVDRRREGNPQPSVGAKLDGVNPNGGTRPLQNLSEGK